MRFWRSVTRTSSASARRSSPSSAARGARSCWCPTAFRSMCDRAVWLSHGEVMAVGDPGHVIDEYAGTAHEDREVTEDEGTRWGSGEVRVIKVELLNAAGERISRC